MNAWLTAALALACGLLAWRWLLPPPAVEAEPYARWRNGVIVYVRNCEAPRGEDQVLRCASLNCARRVTELLTNAQQATLSLEATVRRADGRIEVRGSLEQYLPARTLPTGFVCDMGDHRHPVPEFIFGGRRSTPRQHTAGSSGSCPVRVTAPCNSVQARTLALQGCCHERPARSPSRLSAA